MKRPWFRLFRGVSGISCFPLPEPLPLSSRYRQFGKQPPFPSTPLVPADQRERRQASLREASSRPRHSSLSISRRPACAVNNKVLRLPRRTLRPLCVFYPRVLGKSRFWGCDQEPDLSLALELESRLRLGREERQGAGGVGRAGARLLRGLRRRLWTLARLAEAAAIAQPSIPHSTGGTRGRGARAPRAAAAAARAPRAPVRNGQGRRGEGGGDGANDREGGRQGAC